MSTITKRSVLCAPCQTAWTDWLDYRVNPGIRLVNPGGNSVRAAQAGRASRTQDWAATIRSQQALIVDICGRNHQGVVV